MKVFFGFYVIVLIFTLNTEICTFAMRFGYSRPEQRRWARHHQQCSGKYQSPIAIYSSKAIGLSMPAVEMVGYHNMLPQPLIMHNNGHSVSMSIPKNTTKHRLPYIFGGRLQNEYEIEGLHFHWGDRNNRGSEHVINDIRYAMEMHIIHRNVKYGNMQEALEHDDGLSVLAFFYQLDEFENSELISFIRAIDYIEDFNRTVTLNSTFTLASLFSSVNTERFYTYKGSLTTPPCSEVVTWILFPDTIPVTNSQMIKFRRLSNGIEGSILVDNYRRLQPLGNRRIFLRKINSKISKLSAYGMDNLDDENVDWEWLF